MVRTMASNEAETLSTGRVTGPHWAEAVENYRDGRLTGGSEEDRVAWESAGLVTSTEGLSEDWQEALELATSSPLGITIVARHADLAFLTSAFVDPGRGRLALVTQRVQAEGPDSDTVVAADPALTVTLASRSAWWEALADVLPPSQQFRAAPAVGETERVVLDHLTPEDLTSPETFRAAAQRMPSLPPGIRALVTGETGDQVFTHGVNVDGRALEINWFTAEGLLHRFQPREGALWKVQAGDVGAGLLGMVDELS